MFSLASSGNAILTILSYRLVEDDIINIDITLYLNGYHGDTSQTFDVGNAVRGPFPSPEAYSKMHSRTAPENTSSL